MYNRFTHTQTAPAQQCILIKRTPYTPDGEQAVIKLGAPADDQIHVSVDKKCQLWLPGKIFGPGGYLKYKEPTTAGEETLKGELDQQYNTCLMFRTYANYKTWNYSSSVVGTYYPEMCRITDFTSIMSFKDP